MKLNISRIAGVGSAVLIFVSSYAFDPVLDSALGKASRTTLGDRSRSLVSSREIRDPAGWPLRQAGFLLSGGIRPTEASVQRPGDQGDPLAGWAKVVGLRQSFYDGPNRNAWTLNVDPEFQLSDWVDGRLALAGVLGVVLAVLIIRRKRREAGDMLAEAALERARLRAHVDYAHR